MKMKLFLALQIFSWGPLYAPPSPDKIISMMTEINNALIRIVSHPEGTKKQQSSLHYAQAIVQEAIIVEGIEDPDLFAIAGIIFNDPVYAARAVELQKTRQRADTIKLEKRATILEDHAENYRKTLIDRIEEKEMLLLSMKEDDPNRAAHEFVFNNLKKTQKWTEAQIISHGMLKQAIYMYQNEKIKGE